ncbi:TPA: hypothetical protein ACPZLH_001521 [Yersinia enterocolitica]
MSKLTEQELIELTVVYGNRHNACRAAKELLETRAELAAIKGEQQPVGILICDLSDRRYPCVEFDAEVHGLDLLPDFGEVEVYLHPAPPKDNTDEPM